MLTIVQPVASGEIELGAQRCLERARQHHDPVLAALAVAHDDDLPREIDILDAQPDALEQAHAGAIEQPREQR